MGKRPNTIILLGILVVQIIRTALDSLSTAFHSFFLGRQKPLKTNRFLRLFHWCLYEGPRSFWRFPTALQIGRSLSTLIQVIFYPKNRDSLENKGVNTKKD